MQGAELAELSIFLTVAQLQSFSKAAVERGVAPSAISHAIRKLEQRVGVRLFHRTTRSVALTEAGQRFLADLKPAFGQIGTALDTLNLYRDTPFGTVRVNLPTAIAPFVLRDVMGPLLVQNPGLRLDVVATDRLIDLKTVTVGKDGATVRLKTSAAWGGGAYVLVSVVQPRDPVASPKPRRALGLVYVPLDPKDRKLTVELNTPAKIAGQLFQPARRREGRGRGAQDAIVQRGRGAVDPCQLAVDQFRLLPIAVPPVARHGLHLRVQQP